MRSFREEKSDCITFRRFVRIAASILLVLMLLMSCDVYKQSGSGIYTLKGQVSDGNTKGIAGVKVYIEGGSGKAVTDESGNFSISNVPGQTVTLVAEMDGKILVPVFDSNNIKSNGNSINVEYSTDTWEVNGCDFWAVDGVTIPMIQGTGEFSPLNGVRVEEVIGVVTQVCFEQAHNKGYTTPTPDNDSHPDFAPDKEGTYPEYASKPQVISDDGFYMQLLPNCNIPELQVDGNPATSDGIFISTRDPNGKSGRTSWLKSCKIGNKYPQPGDIVRVTGVVTEYTKADRFGESRGLTSRTQINAESVVVDKSVNSGKIDLKDENLLQLTYKEYDKAAMGDSYRTVPFNDKGVSALKRASDVFESCEGMLVRIDNPIVIGATYYNTTPVLADGGKKDEKYPDQFNEKWMSNVVQKDDFNTEVIFTYYDSNTKFDPLPQIGMVLQDDTGANVFRGVMDYSDNGMYMIYPFRAGNLNISSTPKYGMNYKDLSISTHDKFKFAVNDDVPAESLYNLTSNGTTLRGYEYGDMSTAQDDYQAWLTNPAGNPHFSVPWTEDQENMTVAVFNMENYNEQGSYFNKVGKVANIIQYNLGLPDIIYVVEMGDHDNSSRSIAYENSQFSQNNITGVVSARLNYEKLIEKIKSNSGKQYDYRQIDPVEYTQAGSPGNNIRVGFLFRTDRIEAYDIGLPTVHMNGLSYKTTADGTKIDELYKIPDNLKDGHPKKLSSNSKDGRFVPEPALTLETKKVLAETQTEILGIYDEDGKLVDTTLSQSPGFLQDDRFYNSRLPLVCKFKFKPTGENFYGIALHLYSKGRDDKLYGNIQPPVMTSEIRRAGQSAAVNEFVNEILAMDPNAKVIVAGDVNDFGFTNPIRKLTGEDTKTHQILYSMPASYMPENERFTYVFNGNLQQLDHIFVSPYLYKQLGEPKAPVADWQNHVFVPHVDSLFSRDRHIQVSDHDPIAARINMK